MLSPARRFTAEERVRFRASMQRFYDGFVDKVASGRGLDVEEVEPHCRGRVWTGAQAHERKLVDQLGNLFDALEEAARLAEVPLAALRRIDVSPSPPKLWNTVLRELVMRRLPVSMRMLEVVPHVDEMSEAVEMLRLHAGQPMAWMPWKVELD